MVVERIRQSVRAPCAPQPSNSGARGGAPNHPWQCLVQEDVVRLRGWLQQLGMHPDPHTNAPNCKKKDDACVLDTLSKLSPSRNNVPKALAQQRLRPAAPTSWTKKPATWLTTPEFGAVMRQYEAAYPEFEFLGASPIDFDTPYEDSNTCVWPKICQFTLAKAKGRGKTKIGFVFNEDNHKEPGSHWICAYFDITKGVFYFIDSVGNPMPKEIKALTERLGAEYQTLYGRVLEVRESRVPHQRGDNQCGMYCLFFIIALLTETATYKELMKDRIPDGVMAELRSVLFRKDGAADAKKKPKQAGGRKTRRRRKPRRTKTCKRRRVVSRGRRAAARKGRRTRRRR